LEIFLPLASVGSQCSRDGRTPQGALECGHGRRVGAVPTPDCRHVIVVVRWPQRWVTLRKDVEGRAQVCVVTSGCTFSDVVCLKRVESEVRATCHGSVEVLEYLLVCGIVVRAHSCWRRLSGRMQLCVGQERRRCILIRNRAITVGLRWASVQRVDETAVGAGLWLGDTGLVGRRGRCGRQCWVGGVAGPERRIVRSVWGGSSPTLQWVSGRSSSGARCGDACDADHRGVLNCVLGGSYSKWCRTTGHGRSTLKCIEVKELGGRRGKSEAGKGSTCQQSRCWRHDWCNDLRFMMCWSDICRMTVKEARSGCGNECISNRERLSGVRAPRLESL
jgi:hypothetical protein